MHIILVFKSRRTTRICLGRSISNLSFVEQEKFVILILTKKSIEGMRWYALCGLFMVSLQWCVDYCVIVGLILSYELRCDTTPMYVKRMVENLWMLIHEVEVVLLLHCSCYSDVFPWLDSMRIIKKWWTRIVILVQCWIHGDVCGYSRKWLHMVYNSLIG